MPRRDNGDEFVFDACAIGEMFELLHDSFHELERYRSQHHLTDDIAGRVGALLRHYGLCFRHPGDALPQSEGPRKPH